MMSIHDASPQMLLTARGDDPPHLHRSSAYFLDGRDRTENGKPSRAQGTGAGLHLANSSTTERIWTDREKAVLNDKYPRQGAAACAKLLNRSKSSIYSMAHEQGLRRVGAGAQTNRAPATHQAREVCDGLGISATTLVSWIRNKGLAATLGQEGWRIRRATLRRWIAAHPKAVSLRKVNREWFIDLAFAARRT